MPVLARQDRTADLERAVRDLVKSQVLIGIPAEEASRTPDAGESAGLNNATIGYLMEYGSPEANIPARPHLMPGVEKARPKIEKRLRKAGQDALDGNREAVDQGLHAVGLLGQNAVRAQITDGGHKPLAEATLARRRARGRTGDKPLIDTGQLRRAYTYVIRPKGAS